ncbi:unnamed protein product [Rhizophagus irregularis]|nr:unnamed protein product [Rhizophagus irregularis]
MGFDRYKLILDGVIEKYLENRDKDDKDIQRILMQLLEAKGYGKVLDRESDEFDESDESNETTEESETMKVFEEIIRIDLKMLGYDVEIAEIEKLRKFGSLEDEELDKQILQWRIENTKECKKCEDEKLKKEFRIGREICIECEESQDEDSLRKSETSLEEEERSSDESEKLINTPGKSPSEHSDSEQEKEESKKSIIKTPIVPITPVKPKTMGATRNEVQTDLSTLLDTIYGQNLGLDWNNSAIPAITLTGLQGEIQNNTNAIGNLNTNRGTVVEIPIFYGTKGEDPEEWFFGRGIWQVFFGFLGGVKICFYLMAYGSFRLPDLLINSGLWIWSRFQAIWTLKMAFLGPVQSYSIWGFRSLRFKKIGFEYRNGIKYDFDG